MDTQHFLSIVTLNEMNLRFAAVAGHNDQLSGVLTIHMVCEKIIDLWIESATHNANFFNNVGNINFSNKLQIAKNFSLPDTPYRFMKTLNTIRNKFAHQIDKISMTDEEVESLYDSLSSYLEKHPENDPKKMHVICYGKEYPYNHSNNVNLSGIFYCVYLSCLEGAGLPI
ncbi:TPA: hypothetical protein RE095_004795 [Klebsiella pneumoniae]|nr:hypothetical protein [Klebsiella pneumoniae]